MGALTDLSFTKFISPTIAKIVYIVGAAVIVLAYLAFVIAAFDQSVGLGLLTLVILGPLLALFYLCILRVALESLMATILTAQNTAELVRMGGGTPPGAAPLFPTGPAPSGDYPPPFGQTPPTGPTPPAGPTPPPSAPPAPGGPPAP